jgi:hypothetical protein
VKSQMGQLLCKLSEGWVPLSFCFKARRLFLVVNCAFPLAMLFKMGWVDGLYMLSPALKRSVDLSRMLRMGCTEANETPSGLRRNKRES